MAELHAIGQVVGGKLSEGGSTGLFCKWSVHTGSSWKILSGNKEGQTQVDTPSHGDTSYWAHPLDLHFVTKNLQGWPKIILEVYRQDKYGRSDLAGYGVCHIPASAGTHNLEIPLWRPLGSIGDEILRHFVGGSLEVAEPDLIANSSERCRLKTVPSGTAKIEVGIILRNFENFGVET